MKTVTERQQAILDFLGDHLASTGLPPTVGELARAFGIQPNAARKHLQALAAKGLIEHAPGKARGFTLPVPVGVAPALPLPLVGRVAAAARSCPRATSRRASASTRRCSGVARTTCCGWRATRCWASASTTAT